MSDLYLDPKLAHLPLQTQRMIAARKLQQEEEERKEREREDRIERKRAEIKAQQAEIEVQQAEKAAREKLSTLAAGNRRLGKRLSS